jgi:alpha-D-xyloside xylohydrolase
MNTPVPWQSIAKPLDVFDIEVPKTYLQRWVGYAPTDSGVVFHCQLADGSPVDVRIDFIQPDVFRLRLEPAEDVSAPSDILVQDTWPAPPFDIQASEGRVTLTSERLRLEFPRFPWALEAYDRADDARPFFRERADDRAYGPGYEVAPVGFERAQDGRRTVREAVAAVPGEAFYGFGEKFTPLDKWGQEIISWAVDSGNVTSHRSYKNIPFFLSSAGYGLLVHSSYPMVFRMGSESSVTYSFHVDDGRLDYFVIRGPAFKHILGRYAELTGHAPMPPKWSFGFWISRCMYRSQDEVEDVVREMRRRDFPCDALNIDPWWMGEAPWSTLEWDTRYFPSPEAMIARLRQQGVRVCLWITPYIPADSRLHAEGLARGYFVRRADGTISPALEAFGGGKLAAIDFTEPEQTAWFLEQLERLLSMGVAVFKTDFGEQAPLDAIYADGRSGLEMHNLYPLLYNRAVFGLTERKFGRGLTWGRSGYAGSQRYPVQWGGDSYASFDQMAGQLRGLLGYGLSGVPFCSHDVGGFDYDPRAFDGAQLSTGDHIFNTAALEAYPRDPALYTRWMQFGVFSSHVRAHGKGGREPWAYGPEAEETARRYLKLRYRLLPYIYSEAVRAARAGLPLVRPLVLDFQDDPNTFRIDTQYLFGESLLVAPAFDVTGRRSVYLPAGQWVDYWSKAVQTGGRWIEVNAPLDVLPLWVRAGAILPMGPEMRFVDEKPLDPLTLELYHPQSAGAFEIHDEDRPGITVRYERQGRQLSLEVGVALGTVEIVVYGVHAKSADRDGSPLPIESYGAGQRVQFDGTKVAHLTFVLADANAASVD